MEDSLSSSMISKHISICNFIAIVIEKSPLMYIDVNLDKERGLQRIIIFENDEPCEVAQQFAEKHGLSQNK